MDMYRGNLRSSKLTSHCERGFSSPLLKVPESLGSFSHLMICFLSIDFVLHKMFGNSFCLSSEHVIYDDVPCCLYQPEDVLVKIYILPNKISCVHYKHLHVHECNVANEIFCTRRQLFFLTHVNDA